jgi:hypothetical protein
MPTPMSPLWVRLLQAIGLLLLGAVLALAFVAYQQPDLLLDAVNLRYCG